MSDGITDANRKYEPTHEIPEGFTAYHCYECWSGNGYCTIIQLNCCTPPTWNGRLCPIFTTRQQNWKKGKSN